MHLLMSIGFSSLAVCLMIVYAITFFLLLVAGRYLISLLISHFRKTNRPVFWLITLATHSKKYGVYALCFFLFVQVLLYANLRREWMGEDNAHLQAKEYFVAGMMVSGPVKFLTVFFHPESIIVRPFWNILEVVYEKGSVLLPDNDGEQAVWRQMWFLHRYVKKDRTTKDGHRRRYSPSMVQLLDKIWWCLESMGSKTFADKQIRNQYLTNFSALATYYTIHDAQYLEKTAGSGPVMAKDPLHVGRSRKLVQWLKELETKWQDDTEVTAILNARPAIKVFRQLAIIGSLYRIIDAEIFSREFSCDRESTLLYVKTMSEFVGSKEHPAPLRLLPTTRRERLYNAYVDNIIARFHQLMLKEYCGYDVVGKAGLKSEKIIRSNYKDEFQILEEIFHGR